MIRYPCRALSTTLGCRSSCFKHLRSAVECLVIAAICHTRLHPVAATAQGNWQFDGGSYNTAFAGSGSRSLYNQNIWVSSEAPAPPSSGVLVTDVSARVVVAPHSGVTFAAGEAIVLPLCVSSQTSNPSDSSQDSKITFDASSTITISTYNNASSILVLSQLISGANFVAVSNGYLRVEFAADLDASDSMIVIQLTKLKIASGIVCGSNSYAMGYLLGTRAGTTTQFYTLSSSCYPLIMSGVTPQPSFTAAFSDSRPSCPTTIRIAAPNTIRQSMDLCNNVLQIQLPAYFGTQLNASALSMRVSASPHDPYMSRGNYRALESEVTRLAFDPRTLTLTGTMTPVAAFSPCAQSNWYNGGNVYVHITGLSTPPSSLPQNLQLGIQFSSMVFPVLFPAIETITNAKIFFASSNAAGAQFLVSFVTSLPVGSICGPGDVTNMKQRIVLRIHEASQISQMCSGAAATAKFLSVPNNSPVRIGRVTLSLSNSVCEISLYLSSGDTSTTGCVPRTLPAPDLPSAPIELVIEGLNVSDNPQPPMPVSIDIDEASPLGVTQTCNKCAEWPSTPVFSGSVEVQTRGVFDGYQSLVITLNAIGDISSGDTLTIQIPNGVSYSFQSSLAATLVCIGSIALDATLFRFDVKLFYPNLVLQSRAGNPVMSSPSIKITCTWSELSNGYVFWSWNFDSAPSYNLIIKKETASGSSVRRIRTGFSPKRSRYPSISATLFDPRPGFTTTFSFRASRGSFKTKVLIPTFGFSLLPPSVGVAAVASCSCLPPSESVQEGSSLTNTCPLRSATAIEVQTVGEYLQLAEFSNTYFNYCNMTVRNPIAVKSSGSSLVYIDDIVDYLYSPPSTSSIVRVSVTLSEYTLATAVSATIFFAHTTPLSPSSELQLSGFCNFLTQGPLQVKFASGTASAALNGCILVIAIISGSLLPPPSGSVSQVTVSNLKTPVLRQARSMVSLATYSSSSRPATAIDYCDQCAFISEMPPFSVTVSFSSSVPGAKSVEISIYMKNTWAPLIQGSIISLAIPNVPPGSSAFPGDWKGSSSAPISVNGDVRDATISLQQSALIITYLGASVYTTLDTVVKLGPFYTVPRKNQKSFLFQVNKSSNAAGTDSVSALAVFPEIAGSCPAGYFLNATSSVCERCSGFRYNDGTMAECKLCAGQEIGESNTKATKCIPWCSWPFEYMYDEYNNLDSSCVNDGGLCTRFSSSFVDTECQCSVNYGYSYNPVSPSTPYSGRCLFFNLNANTAAVATVFSVFIVIFICCITRLPSKPNSTLQERLRTMAKLFFLAFFPALDFLSDMVYILTSKFNSIIIFFASVFFFVLPMFMFMRQLMRHRAHIHFYLVPVPKSLQLADYDNIPKLLYGFFVHLPFYILNLPTIIPLFLAGHFLYCAKLIPLSNVSNVWLRFYTGRRDHDSRISIILNLLQESIFEEIVTESLPQLVIQAVNQTMNKEWTPLGYVSMTLSSVMALNGVYRFLYYFLMKRIPIKEVPSGLEDDVFELEGVELGKYALQLPPPTDIKAAPLEGAHDLSKHRYSVELNAIELQPLIQRVETAENQNASKFEGINSKINSIDVRIEGMDAHVNGIFSRIDGVDSKFNGLDSRFDGMDSKFNGLDSRIDGMDSKFNGLDSRIDGMDSKFNGLDSRFDGMDSKFNGLDSRFDGMDAQVNGIFSRIDGMDSKFNGVDARFDTMEAKLNGILEALSKAPQ